MSDAPGLEASTVPEVAAMVAGTKQTLLPRGGGSKPALSRPPSGTQSLELGGLRGVVEYEPSEFTVTVRAGTKVSEVASALREHGQYLPFDPLLADAGATVGGVVASGTNGPGRVRYGGVRDFLLGVRFVDGRGRLARGGGTVVKNAAGFDLPKLMVGSLGRLGVLVELTFKVFPAPEATRTVRARLASLAAMVSLTQRLLGSPRDLDAVELAPPAELWLRIAGPEAALVERAERLLRETVGAEGVMAAELVAAAEAATFWRAARELTWAPAGLALVKVPITPGRISTIDRRLDSSVERRYGSAGQQLLVAWPGARVELSHLLAELGLRGLVLRHGDDDVSGGPILGAVDSAGIFAERIKGALDPDARFLPL